MSMGGYRKGTSIRQAPIFRHLESITEEPMGSLLSGWMNYNYTACRWFPTSSNIFYFHHSSDKSGLKVTDCTVQSAEYWCFYGTSFPARLKRLPSLPTWAVSEVHWTSSGACNKWLSKLLELLWGNNTISYKWDYELPDWLARFADMCWMRTWPNFFWCMSTLSTCLKSLSLLMLTGMLVRNWADWMKSMLSRRSSYKDKMPGKTKSKDKCLTLWRLYWFFFYFGVCVVWMMMFRWTNKQPEIQKFWNLCHHYRDIYDWISQLNKLSGSPFILTQQPMGRMSKINTVICLLSHL